MITDKTTDYKRKGLPLEALVDGANSAFARTHGFENVWTGQESYRDSQPNPRRRGVDSKLYSNRFLKALWLIDECKNFSEPMKQYTEDVANREIISRDKSLSPMHRALVLPSFEAFTTTAKNKVSSDRWAIFETKKVIAFEDFENGSALDIAREL
jgi:hypothetical protein